jgi:hypothetical protein
MACNTALLSVPPPCALKFNSYTQQEKDLNFLLAAAIKKIDVAFTINWATFLTEANALVVCVPPGVARAKAAEIVESGLVITSLTAQNCYSRADLERVRLYLTCILIGKINP